MSCALILSYDIHLSVKDVINEMNVRNDLAANHYSGSIKDTKVISLYSSMQTFMFRNNASGVSNAIKSFWIVIVYKNMETKDEIIGKI